MVAWIHSRRMVPASAWWKMSNAGVPGAQCGMVSGATFHSRASAAT